MDIKEDTGVIRYIAKNGTPRVISKEDREVISKYKGADLLKANKDLLNLLNAEVKRRTAEYLKRYAVERVITIGLLQAILHPRIIKRINKLNGQPLRGLSERQINILLGCYICSKLKNNCFTARGLLVFAPTYYNLIKVNNELQIFRECNYIEPLDAGQIYRRADAKTLRNYKNKRGRPATFHGLTIEGEQALKLYFDLFDSYYKKINDSFLANDIENLIF